LADVRKLGVEVERLRTQEQHAKDRTLARN
jgi:hypothetical protein